MPTGFAQPSALSRRRSASAPTGSSSSSINHANGLRVYVESQYYAWEFNVIKEAILSGRLTLTT